MIAIQAPVFGHGQTSWIGQGGTVRHPKAATSIDARTIDAKV